MEYRIHFVGRTYEVKVNQQKGHLITLQDDDFHTSTAVLNIEETYKQKDKRIYIFTFQAEDITHVCKHFISMVWMSESM